MKKTLSVMLCMALCLAVASMMPKSGVSNPNVDDTGCTVCHDASFDAGSLHDTHTGQACTICHATTGDSPAASKCVVCHPVGDPGACNLVNFHDPAVADCLMCHADCEPGPTTTTTTAAVTTTTTSVPVTGDISVSPDTIRRSRWVVIPAVLLIKGTDFDRRTSKPAYSPDNALIPLPPLQLNAETIVQTILVKPEWWALAGNQTVTVTVDGSSADFDIELLPFILDK